MTGASSPSPGSARLEELYQSVILDHNRRPRNHGEMTNASARAEGKNPNCGDRVIVWLRLEGDTVADVSFKVPPGEGCAISRASASLMTTAVKGKSVAETEELFERFIAQLTAQRTGQSSGAAGAMGPLEVLSGVSRFPHRVKCATMAWHALHSALREATADSAGP